MHHILSIIFILSSLLLIVRSSYFAFKKPRCVDLKKNLHSREFNIANAGPSLRTSIFLSATWITINAALINNESNWSGFLGNQTTLEVVAIMNLFLCHHGCIGISSGRIKAFNEGEKFNLLARANGRVHLICLATIIAYIFGFVLHLLSFYVTE